MGRTDTYSPFRISGARMINLFKNSMKVLFVGYPAHFTLMASRTPCTRQMSYNTSRHQQNTLAWKIKMKHWPQSVTDARHWHCQTLLAATNYLASHIWCSVVPYGSVSPSAVAIVAVPITWTCQPIQMMSMELEVQQIHMCAPIIQSYLLVKTKSQWIRRNFTLKRAPMDENFDLLLSLGRGGKRPDTKEHLEAFNMSWCSATT